MGKTEQVKFFKSIIDTVSDAVIVVQVKPEQNQKIGIVYVNKAFTAMTGYAAEEVLGKSLRIFQGPKTDLQQLHKIKSALLKRELCEITIVSYKKDGSAFWIYLSIPPLANETDLYIHLFVKDIDFIKKKELDNLLPKAVDIAAIGGWEYDFLTQKVYLSEMSKRIYGVDTGDEPDLDKFSKFCKHRSESKHMLKCISEMRISNLPFDLEMEMLTIKKKSRWIRIIGEPELVGGQCTRVMGSFQDIDARKRAELLVQKTIAEKDEILESIGDGFFTLNKKWKVTYWNSWAAQVLQKSKKEVLNKNFWDVFPEAIGSESYEKYHWAVKNNKKIHFEIHYASSGKWYEISAYPSSNGLSVYFEDISERKIGEKRILESEKRYSSLFQLSPLPQWVFDIGNLKFLDVNRAAIESYGYSFKEFMRMTILDIRPTDSASQIEQVLNNKILKKDFVNMGIFTHRKKNGELIQVEIQSSPIFYKGRVAKIIIANDISKREEYINAIEKQNQKLKEVSWTQSHVFRAPLSKIMGLVGIAKFADDESEKQKILNHILAAATELDHVIRDITAKTKID